MKRFEVHAVISGIGAVTHLMRAADEDAIYQKLCSAYPGRMIKSLDCRERGVSDE